MGMLWILLGEAQSMSGNISNHPKGLPVCFCSENSKTVIQRPFGFINKKTVWVTPGISRIFRVH